MNASDVKCENCPDPATRTTTVIPGHRGQEVHLCQQCYDWEVGDDEDDSEDGET